MSTYTWLGLALAVLIYYGPFQNLLESIARHRIFMLRDHLFDRAAAGEIDFDSREYQRARYQFNSLIRFTHKLKWQNLLAMYQLAKRGSHEYESSPLYDEYRARVGIVLLALIVLRSPVLFFGLMVLMLFAFVSVRFTRVRRQAASFVHFVEERSLC